MNDKEEISKMSNVLFFSHADAFILEQFQNGYFVTKKENK